MPQWVYLRLDLNDAPRRGDEVDILNKAGSEGWVLVSVTGQRVAYLKREIAALAKSGRPRTAAPASAG